MQFPDLCLIDPLLRSIQEEGYAEPTPIQAQAVPPLLAGRDLVGIAQTGTGKTAAFALPILQRLMAGGAPSHGRRAVRALVVTPTRELAAQIDVSFKAYGRYLPLRCTAIFGGVGQRPQERAIANGIDVLVATPGRLLDLMEQRLVDLSRLEVFVLDEADRMLDMGFLPAVRRIVAALPSRRQTVFFSATMGTEPRALADSMLRDPVRVAVAPPATTVERVAQSVYFVEKGDKQGLLRHLLEDPAITRALVFTRTKHGADRVATKLVRSGVDAAAIHANKSQGQRTRALDGFRSGATRILVATDIAARGIDVDDVSHVVNFDLPNVAESYVHRIGRTARAGAEGCAISFCDREERAYLRDIERETRRAIPVVTAHPFAGSGSAPSSAGAGSHGAGPAAAPRGASTPHRGTAWRPARHGTGPARPHGHGGPRHAASPAHRDPRPSHGSRGRRA